MRLFQGDFDKQTVYADDPVGVARRFRQSGFDHLHVVDLDGARGGLQRNQETVAAIVEATDLTVQLGGGIRDRETLDRWLGAGVARCVVGSLAVTDPQRVAGWIRDRGADRIVLALDVRCEGSKPPVPAVDGWSRASGADLWQCIGEYAGCGLRHVLCTDVAQDGTLRGPNLDLYREFRERYPDLELQASGGVRHAGDLAALADLGCAAAITGRAVLDGHIRAEDQAS